MRNLKFSDIASAMPLQERVSAETLKKLIKKELEVSGVKTKFEFVIFNSGVTTKIKSGDFKYNKSDLFNSSFTDNEGNENINY
jgi:two-component system phosphate regulon sensor histidine kinase PhoR